ncbi:ASCH domain-containing protein [Kordia sp.]|uniref:ASCH domain-containing protein n=1 Tax=Kordia sp. TaxID=1965332 RepID=UPI003D267B30
MKYLPIILCIVLISCKSESKTEVNNENTVVEMWNNYVKSNPEFKKDEQPDSWYFHMNREDANRLAILTLEGKKQASSGLYTWYKEANADLPTVGTKHIITDFDGKATAIIEITKVDTIPFHKITKTHAEKDMGTTIEPLKKWKKSHWDFFESALKESGEKPTENMLVVCEQFKTIWPQ